MKSLWLTCVLCCCCCWATYAQGWWYDSTDVPTLITLDNERSTKTLPTAYSLRPYAPTPVNQSPQYSCVAWATVYAAWTIQQRFVQKNPNLSPYSAPFLIYYLHRETFNNPIKIKQALDSLQQKGVIAMNHPDYTPNYKTKPSQQANLMAIKAKIRSFGAFYDTRLPDKMSPEQLIVTLKKRLNVGQPVIVGLKVNASFREQVNKTWTGGDINIADIYHAVCVIGYDGERFELMNSWGTTWRDGGFGWISTDALKKHCLQAFVIQQ